MHNGPLQELPKNFCEIHPELTSVYFTNNSLKSINLYECKYLVFVWLDSNGLEHFPDISQSVDTIRSVSVRKNKIRAFESMLIFGFDSAGSISLNKYNLFYNNRIVSKEEVVETLGKCDCCERHKINRPKKLAPWVDTDFHDTLIRSCPCHCRQFSRFICREIM